MFSFCCTAPCTSSLLFLRYNVDRGTDGTELDVKAMQELARKRKRVRENLATGALVGTFLYHMAPGAMIMMTDIENVINGCFIVVRASAYAAIELIAAGAFQKEVTTEEMLQELVQERAVQICRQAAQIVRQNDELKTVGLALQASETALAVTNGDREIVWSSPALQRLTDTIHLAGAPHLNRRLEDVLSSSNSDASVFVSCFKDNGSAEVEIMMDNKIIQVQVSPSAAATSETSEKRFVVVLKDITESRALEANQRAQDEALTSKTINEAMETLTHELRTPLQGIMGMTSLILDNDEGSLELDTKESLALFMVSSRLLLTLINNILDVRKCDASMLNDFELYHVPAKPPLTDAVDFCRLLSTIIGVDLSFDVSPVHSSAESAILLSDTLRIQQVGINLVSNAIKYTPKGSTIKIHSSIMTLSEVEAIIDGAIASGEHHRNGTTLRYPRTTLGSLFCPSVTRVKVLMKARNPISSRSLDN